MSACVILLTAGGASLLRGLTTGALELEQRDAHASGVIETAQAFTQGAKEAQNGLRGFMVTRDRSFLLLGYEARWSEARAALRQLAELVADDPAQRRRVAELQGLAARWHDDHAEVLIAQFHRDGWEGRAPSPPPAVQMATGVPVALDGRQERLVDLEQQAMVATCAQVGEVIANERATLAALQAVSRARADRTDRLAWLASVLVTLVGVAGALLLPRRLRRDLAELAASARAIASGDLGRRARIDREDELGSLARSFNAMAAQLDRRRLTDAVLKHMRDLLHSSESIGEASDVLAGYAPQCLPGSAGRLYLMNAERDLLVHAAGWGDGPGEVAFTPAECWGFRTGQVHSVRDPAADVACLHPSLGAVPRFCLPLAAHGETLGLLHLHGEGDDVPKVAAEIAGMLGPTLANLRLREVMHAQATRDALTNLPNRRFLAETFRRELARAQRLNTPIAVLLLDVDHFKLFNDRHGHAGGDALLKGLAALLERTFHADDLVCRYGGEEFVILLSRCSLEDALARAEQLRRAVGSLAVEHEGRPLGRVTVSIGAAWFPEHGTTADEIIAAADQALYAAKREGRDRVVAAPPADPTAIALAARAARSSMGPSSC